MTCSRVQDLGPELDVNWCKTLTRSGFRPQMAQNFAPFGSDITLGVSNSRPMTTLIRRISLGLLIVIVTFFGLKGCLVTIWSSPKSPETYAVSNPDGRVLSLVFLPKQETIMFYTPDSGDSVEISLTKMCGTYGTHYFWRLWSVDGPGYFGGLLGYRIFPEGYEPVVMETTVLRKFQHGSKKTVLSAEGERTHPLILFSKNAIQFEGMTLEKLENNPVFIGSLLEKVRP